MTSTPLRKREETLMRKLYYDAEMLHVEMEADLL